LEKDKVWYSWESPVGMGIGLTGLGLFFVLGALALWILVHL
jgi:hypothetical protein